MAEVGEDMAAINQDPKNTKVSWMRRIFSKYLLIVTLGFILGGFHAYCVSSLFQADRNFSLLSPLEREMSLKTEMGFYYSYYKTIVEEKPLLVGLSKIMYDNIVEYPKEVNAINRFNIHPEVAIGALFNYLEPYLNETVECFMLDRGDLPEVDSCVGLGVPIYFYLEVIWWLSGLTVAMLFFISASLCDTVSAGMLCIIFYVCHHMDATRVMWTPNERENFAQPFLLTQMFLITIQLRKSKEQVGGLCLQFAIVLFTCICLLCWQFTQFIFLTQIVILYFMEQLNIISAKALCIFLHGHFCAIHLALLLLHGNDMLKTSLYVCVFLVLSIYALFFSYFRTRIRTRMQLVLELIYIVLRVLLVIEVSTWMKKFANLIFEADEDSHVYDILFAKLGLVKSFHTMMYTCAAVFDFMPYATWAKLTNSGVIPLAGIAIVNVLGYHNYIGRRAVKEYLAKKAAKMEKESENDDEQVRKPEKKCLEKEKDEALENLIIAENEASLEDENSVERSKDDVGNAAEGTIDPKADEASKDDEILKDAKCVDNDKEAKATEDTKDVKSTKKSNHDKSADQSQDAKTVENSNDDNSGEKSKYDKTADQCKDANSSKNSEDDKSADHSKDAKSGEKSKDGKPAETPTETKSTQTPLNDAESDAKALEEAKAAKKAKKAKARQNRQELDKIIVYLRNLHIDAAMFYNIAQMAVFGLMAALVMRLKLLFVPHLCIVASCSSASRYYTRFSRKRKVLTKIIMAIFVGMAMYKSRVNMKQELSYVGQYSDVYLEELLKWIAEETRVNAVFAGPMPVTAAVMLTSRRAIVNHPHYENSDARHRNYIVYKMYGRFPPQQYHDELTKLKVTHLIIDKTYCYGESKSNCSFSNIWDIEYPSLKDQPLLCDKLISGELQHFYRIFNNPMYTVVWVHDYSIKYNPKLLNT